MNDGYKLTFETSPSVLTKGVCAGQAAMLGRTIGLLNTLGILAMGAGFAAIGWVGGWIVACWILPDVLPLRETVKVGIILGCLSGILGVIVRSRIATHRLAKMYIRGPASMSIQAEVVEYEDRLYKSIFPWSSVSHVVEFKDGFSICMSASIYVVPWSAFPEDQDRTAALAQISGWQEAA